MSECCCAAVKTGDGNDSTENCALRSPFFWSLRRVCLPPGSKDFFILAPEAMRAELGAVGNAGGSGSGDGSGRGDGAVVGGAADADAGEPQVEAEGGQGGGERGGGVHTAAAAVGRGVGGGGDVTAGVRRQEGGDGGGGGAPDGRASSVEDIAAGSGITAAAGVEGVGRQRRDKGKEVGG